MSLPAHSNTLLTHDVCAGVGKTSLFNHLAQQQVTEVLPGNQGNVSEVECSVVCEGLAWTLCDIPGVNGEHQIKDPKRLWLREVNCQSSWQGLICGNVRARRSSGSQQALQAYAFWGLDTYRTRTCTAALCRCMQSDCHPDGSC